MRCRIAGRWPRRLQNEVFARGRLSPPTLAAFAGGAVGDRYGRVDPDTPNADPEKPAWTLPGQKTVYLAVRRDLRPPPLKIRKSLGGTMQLELNGEAAARFYGALA